MVDSELLGVLSNWKDEIKNEFKNEMNSFKTEIKDEMNSFKTEVKDEINLFEYRVTNKLILMDQKITSIGNICTTMQKDHSEKLNLLLDYASANIEKHDEYDKNFQRVDNKLFDHDVRLAIVEGSDLYKKLIKGKGKSALI